MYKLLFNLTWMAIIVLNYSCRNNTRVSESKKHSPILLKDGSFVYIKLMLDIVNKNEMYANISFTNQSNNVLLYYKELLPLNSNIRAKIFTVFNDSRLEEVRYLGSSFHDYLKLGEDDTEGVIIPKLNADNFLKLKPYESATYRINISKFYDFSTVKSGDRLFITYSTYLPAVSEELKQLFEMDSTDRIYKPVYFDVGLPKKELIDSMRVYFTLPND